MKYHNSTDFNCGKSDLWIKKFIYLRFTKPVSLSYSAVGTFWNNWKGTERKAENRKCRGKKIKNERKMEKRKKIWMSRSRASKILAISRLKKLKKIRRRLTQWTLFFIIIIILIFISYLIFPLPRSYLLFPVTPTGNYALYLSFRPCFPGKLYKG